MGTGWRGRRIGTRGGTCEYGDESWVPKMRGIS